MTRLRRGPGLSFVLPAGLILILLLAPLPHPAPDWVWVGGAAEYLHAVSWRLYDLIKDWMLWVPLGLLIAVAGAHPDRLPQGRGPAAGPGAASVFCSWRGLAGVAWLMAAGMAFAALWLAPAWASVLQVAPLLAILAPFPGLAAGYWLGGRLALPPDALQSGLAPTFAPRPGHAAPAAARRGARTAGGWMQAVLGVLVLALAAWGLAEYPRWQLWLGAGLLIYAAAFWRWPWLGLVVVPAALPLLDLAPWSGRFFLDEFDLLVMVTLALLLLRGSDSGARRPWQHTPLLWLFLLAWLVSLALGLLPLPAWDVNAADNYWSPYNALRVAKGLGLALVLFLLLRAAGVERPETAHRLALGMGIGLLGVGLVGAWEHIWFVDQAQQATYRIISTFSSMHTGGGHIGAYLAAALPFLWLAVTRPAGWLLAGPILLLTGYVMLFTVARSGVLGLAVVVAILLLATWRLAARRTPGGAGGALAWALPGGLLLTLATVVAVGASQGHFQQRFATVGEDLQTRLGHWRLALALRDDDFLTHAFGMGLGSFPRVYQARAPLADQPASFGFASADGNTHFRIGTGATVYFAQRIGFRAGEVYRLEFEARSRYGETRLDVPICEKQMLDSRHCAWNSFRVPGDGAWHRVTQEVSSASVGLAHWSRRPPVELFLYHAGSGGVVDVDNVRLLDAEGRDLLCNGDFSQAGDCWLFKSHSHLPWHIKQLGVHLLFEHGWVGLTLFLLLAALALARLARAAWGGQRLAWAVLASLAGLLTVGLFDSILDAPRLTLLLGAWLLLGVAHPWTQPRVAGISPARPPTPR